MKKEKRADFLRTLAISLAIGIAVSLGLNIAINGMRLLGVPQAKEIEKITVVSYGENELTKEFTDSEKIDLAVGLTGFLNYSLFSQVQDQTPLIEITYRLSDGQEISVSANETAVWWNGKGHALKQEGAFIKLAKAIFFLEEEVKD